MVEQETMQVNRLESIVERAPAPSVIQVAYALPPTREKPFTQHCEREVLRSFVGRGYSGVFIDDRFSPESALYLPKKQEIFGYTTSILGSTGRRRLLVLSDTQIPLDPEQDSICPELKSLYERVGDADQSLSPLPTIEGRSPDHWEVMDETAREKSRQLKYIRRQEQVTTRRLRRLAYVDDLTELPNRQAYFSDAVANMREAIEYRRMLHVMALDAIGFKEINDRVGQDGGDMTISQLGQVLRRLIRPQDKAYRRGGDEFRIITDANPYMLATRFNKVIPVSVMTVKNNKGEEVNVSLKGVYAGIASFDGSRSGLLPDEQLKAMFMKLEHDADEMLIAEKKARKAR